MTGDTGDRREKCVACGASCVAEHRIRLGYPIYRCAACSTSYAALTREQLPSYDEHYEEESHYGGYHRLAQARKLGQNSLYWFQPRMLQTAGEGDGRLHIDIGSGLGTFLCHSRDQGWKVLGLDVSAKAAGEAKAVFDIDTHVGSIDSIGLEQASVHWISAFEVLEHVFDPRHYVERFFELLAPGGLVTISVPNGRSRQEMHSTNPILTPPTHINYFSRTGVNRMFEQAGFSKIYDYEKPLPWGEIPAPRAAKLLLMPLLLIDRVLGHGGNRLLWVGRK